LAGRIECFDMRHLACLLLCVCSLPLVAGAEVICALGPGAASYDGKSDQRPTADAMELAKRVNAALSPTCTPRCPEMAIYRNPTAPNAMLVVTTDQAKVVYAPQFFSAVYDNYGDGGIIAMIAHEYGHALAEVHPVDWMKSDWNAELKADAWAGCALAKSDLSVNDLADALTAMSKYPPANGSSWPLRLPALRIGYLQCSGNSATFDRATAGAKRH
jgi:hypothetical protein